MKKLLALILALAMVFALCACGNQSSTTEPENTQTADEGAVSTEPPASTTETIELKLGHPLSPTSSQHIYLQAWADMVYEESGGKYHITIYPSSQFGEAKELVESLSMGVYDVGWCDTGVMDFLVPEINLLYMPFFFQNYDQLWAAVDSEVGEALAVNIEEEANIHPLSFFSLGCRQIFSRNEISDLASLKNLKFRVPELDLWINTFATLGMAPTPVAWSELYTALSTGVVDGGCANWEYIATQGFYKEAPYIWESSHFFQTGIPSFNLDFWDSLSEEDQQMFTDTCAEIAEQQRADVESKDQGYKDQILADGGSILPLEDFTDLEEVYALYQEGLWKDIVAAADAQDLYEIMCAATGRSAD
ncbi:MAG: TRAP transporter substrate-binding protein [Clostridia bacterium]|nr:TRAP transporter substrate-binding protein [Clostridia bacterium]